jgi:hypothetical protein
MVADHVVGFAAGSKSRAHPGASDAIIDRLSHSRQLTQWSF